MTAEVLLSIARLRCVQYNFHHVRRCWHFYPTVFLDTLQQDLYRELDALWQAQQRQGVWFWAE